MKYCFLFAALAMVMVSACGPDEYQLDVLIMNADQVAVAGAEVSIEPSNQQLVSDDGGRVSIRGLEAQHYLITASDERYGTAQYLLDLEDDQSVEILLPGRDNQAPQIITYHPGGDFRDTLIHEDIIDGQVLTGFRVVDDRDHPLALTVEVTDGDGKVLFAGAPSIEGYVSYQFAAEPGREYVLSYRVTDTGGLTTTQTASIFIKEGPQRLTFTATPAPEEGLLLSWSAYRDEESFGTYYLQRYDGEMSLPEELTATDQIRDTTYHHSSARVNEPLEYDLGVVDRNGTVQTSARLTAVLPAPSIPLGGSEVSQLVLDAPRRQVYAIDATRGELYAGNLATREWIQTASVGPQPVSAVLTADGRQLVVANRQSSQLRIFDADDLSRPPTLHPLPEEVVAYQTDGIQQLATLYDDWILIVTPRKGVCQYNLVSRQVIRLGAEGENYAVAVVGPGAKFLITAGSGSNPRRVARFELGSDGTYGRSQQASLHEGGYRGLVLSGDGQTLYVGPAAVDPLSLTVQRTFTLGSFGDRVEILSTTPEGSSAFSRHHVWTPEQDHPVSDSGVRADLMTYDSLSGQLIVYRRHTDFLTLLPAGE